MKKGEGDRWRSVELFIKTLILSLVLYTPPLPPIFYIVSFINLVVLQQISNKMVE